jgi:hypothetical protein
VQYDFGSDFTVLPALAIFSLSIVLRLQCLIMGNSYVSASAVAQQCDVQTDW